MVEMGELGNERREIYVGIGRIKDRQEEGRKDGERYLEIM